MRKNKTNDADIDTAETNKIAPVPDDPERREALEKLVKYTPPAMITLLAKDSAWAQISGGPPPPPSDLRLKTDIEFLGNSANGHRLYSFRYKNDDANIRYVGVMAQDVVEVKPEAVVIRDDGYYAVHYDQLGLTLMTYDRWQRLGDKSVCETELNKINQAKKQSCRLTLN